MKKTLSALGAVALMLPAAHAQTNHYVWSGGNQTAPYTNWTTAARDIQSAVNASAAGAVIWVTNGTYNTGGVSNYPAGSGLTNRVAINKAVTVISVNGPGVTTIEGRWHNPGGAPANSNYFGSNAVRCVYMVAGARLAGFTLTKGAVPASGSAPNLYGGGVWCETGDAVVSNCVFIANTANQGGASYRGVFYDCVISNNWGASYGGGLQDPIRLHNCAIRNNSTSTSGGGSYGGSFYNCEITGNSVGHLGGGVYAGGAMYNCLVAGNYSGNRGAGVWRKELYNCTVTGNSSGTEGGGVYFDSSLATPAWNCVVYNNTAATGSNYWGVSNFSFSCAAPLPAGPGNIDAAPMFSTPGAGYGTNLVYGDYRLALGSPCVNAGTNFPWQSDDPLGYGRNKDLDRQPRLRGQVDMGAYEQYISPGTIFIIRGQ